MRLAKLSASLPMLLILLGVPTLSLRTQETDTSPKEQKGSAPRSSADKYKAHATHRDVSFGAELLSRKQVSKEFAADLNSCCLVVEVAVYPDGTEPLKLSRDDFTLSIESTDVAAIPQSATVVSAKLIKDTNGSATTVANVGVGLELGTYTDPETGRPVHGHGVTTSAGVGVAAGNTPATVAERQREVIEQELSEKSLPQAKISVPVSGYLYFSLPKQKKNAKYRLEYSIKEESLVLSLP